MASSKKLDLALHSDCDVETRLIVLQIFREAEANYARGDHFAETDNEYNGWVEPDAPPKIIHRGTHNTVFMTKNGGSYHKIGCRHLEKRKNELVEEVTVDHAVWQGREACAECFADDF